MIKVAQWATGSVGMWSLREIIRHPDLELVGLRVYSPDKVGLNVITVSDYISPRLQSDQLYERLNSAAKRGGVTLHGTGIDPGFLCDRLPATLTGLSTEVEHIEMVEIADLRDHPNPSMIMELLGFGMKPGEFRIDPGHPGLQYCATMFPQALHTLFELLKVPWGRLGTARRP